MDKLDIHESLRLYLPGLFLMILLKYLLGLNWSNITIATAAIFMAFFIDSFDVTEAFFRWHLRNGDKYKNYFLKEYLHNYFQQRVEIFHHRFIDCSRIIDYLENRYDKEPRVEELNLLSRALEAFDSTRYNNLEIQQMRLYNSYGRVQFTLGLICFLGFFITMYYKITTTLLHTPIKFEIAFLNSHGYNSVFLNSHGGMDSVIFLIGGLVLLNGGVKMWNKSLEFEIRHYKSYPNKEDSLVRLREIILLELDMEASLENVIN